jgi:hypothetical protein
MAIWRYGDGLKIPKRREIAIVNKLFHEKAFQPSLKNAHRVRERTLNEDR